MSPKIFKTLDFIAVTFIVLGVWAALWNDLHGDVEFWVMFGICCVYIILRKFFTYLSDD